MSTLQDRVREAVAAGFRKSQLARFAGVSSGAVSQWLSGEVKTLRADSALGLQEGTGWAAQWWVSGLGPRQPDKHPSVAPSFDGLSDAQLTPFDHTPRLPWELVVQQKQPLPRLFRVAVPDDALAPRTPKGTEFIFDRAAAPAPGLAVLVEDKEGNRYIRRYTQGAGARWSATVSNESYVTLHSQQHGLRLIAVAQWRADGSA